MPVCWWSKKKLTKNVTYNLYNSSEGKKRNTWQIFQQAQVRPTPYFSHLLLNIEICIHTNSSAFQLLPLLGKVISHDTCFSALAVKSEAYFTALSQMGEQAFHTMSSRSIGKGKHAKPRAFCFLFYLFFWCTGSTECHWFAPVFVLLRRSQMSTEVAEITLWQLHPLTPCASMTTEVNMWERFIIHPGMLSIRCRHVCLIMIGSAWLPPLTRRK